ncbi:MAG: uracil-DNA glycosylase [Hyphomicrobium sp.]|nr:MAG: uracil-DNA glycosylase [Hyphomicrobium sp.]PPC99342.1 MAG: uracil-DNA glycosylase [Hyphomicrobium sp.]
MTEPRFDLDIFRIIDWYKAAGVDAALDDLPVDWLARGPAAPGQGFAWPDRQHVPTDSAPNAHAPMPRMEALSVAPIKLAQKSSPSQETSSVRPQTPLAASEAETEARRIAATAPTLAALEVALRGFNGCSLKATAKNLCFYRGAETARIMLIGEAPGRDEDLEGKPFVGRAGQLLDKMLAAIGLSESDVHITNVVYWRPPGNRTPTPQEALACRPFLERQMTLVRPEIVVALGGSAAKEVLGISEGIMKLRGKWRTVQVGSNTVTSIATLHPAYLLRTPAAKQLVWSDLIQIKKKLGSV